MALPRIFFVVNPGSGTQSPAEKDAFIARLDDHARHLHFTYEVFKLTGGDDLRALRDRLMDFLPDVVAAVGGDGTCNLLLPLLRDQPAALGIVPFGSANGLAAEFGIDDDEGTALGHLVNGRKLRCDLLLLNDKHYSLHLSDIGMNARMIKRFERENRRGLYGYFRQFWREVIRARPRRFRLYVGKEKWRKKVHMIAFANGRKYGTGAVLNPSGRPDDGQFELILIRPYPRWAVVSIAYHFFLGDLRTSPYAEIHPCREVMVRRRRPFTFQTDGEVHGYTRELRVRLLPRCLTVMVPAYYSAAAIVADID